LLVTHVHAFSLWGLGFRVYMLVMMAACHTCSNL